MGKMQQKKSMFLKMMMIMNRLVLLAGIVFILLATLWGMSGRTWYKILLPVLVAGYSLMYNISNPYIQGSYESMTRQQGKSYLLYVLTDAAALFFLALFAVNAGAFDEPFHYVALGIFLILCIPRHNLYRQATEGFRAGKKGQSQERAGGYKTLSAMETVRQRDAWGRGRMVKGAGRAARRNKRTSEGVSFADPMLREDRFVNMKLEDFVGGRSVDEMDNISKKD